MEYKEYRNEIPYNTLKTWSKLLLENTRWQPIGWTGDPKEPLRHWSAYPELEGLIKQIWDFIYESIREDGLAIKPHRIVLNLYSHGDSSWLHTDSQNSEDYTVILFLNDHWDINWAGDFILVENNEIIKAFATTPGKFVCFKSNIQHGARPVSREAPYPRLGIAYQCINDSNVQGLSTPKISSIRTTL